MLTLPRARVYGSESVAGRVRSWSKAQLMDFQGDLMIWCPELKPTFVDGVDPETGIHERSDNGATPHGIHAGWVWSVWLPWYPPAKRQIFYDEVKRQRFTHVAIQACEQRAGDTGYHGLRPISQADADGYGALMNVVHQELVDAGLIPVCAGVAPGPANQGGANLAPGFDAEQVLVAMGDWDNTPWAAGRIKAIAETFPRALLYYERPQHAAQAHPDPDPFGGDPVPPTATNGGQWIREMQRRYPRFVGVLYEVNIPDGLDACVAELTLCNGWWRDVQQILLETDTYWKFWENYDATICKVFNDELRSRCPQLTGFLSSGTTHAPLPNIEGPVESGGDVGVDMIDVGSIQFIGPNIGAFPKTTAITRLDLRQTGIDADFTKRDGPDAWPERWSPAFIGKLQYSYGLVLKIGGQWYASAPIELFVGLHESGGPIMQPGQIPGNWFYALDRWGPLAGYQPQPGETIGFFVCAGDARNAFFGAKGEELYERSNIVAFQLPADGHTLTVTWT